MPNAPSRLDAITTRWTLLREAHATEDPSAEAARQALVLRYMPAIRRYLTAIVKDADAADDLSQDVAVRLMSGAMAGADPQRGRFRDLLKTAVRNMARNEFNRRRRRRTVDFPTEQTAGDGAAAPDPWLEAWRARLLELTWQALRQQERAGGGSPLATVLRLRADHPDESSTQLAERLSRQQGRPIRPDAFRQLLRRARLKMADLLLLEVSRGLSDPSPERLEDEMIALGLHDRLRGLLPEGFDTAAR